MLDRALQLLGLRKAAAPASAPLNILELVQRDAWQDAGFLDRVDDPGFAYSARYVVPDAVQMSILALITMAGQGPIELKGPTPPSRFQEKLTFPFVEAAYRRLDASGAIPADLLLGDSLLVGTAPLASIYPRVVRNRVDGRSAVMFSTGMLVLHMLVGELLARAGESRTRPKGLEDVLCGCTLSDLRGASTTIHGIAESLFGLVTQNWPYPAHGIDYTSMQGAPFVAEMLSDAFAFCLLHELAHVSLGHFSDEAAKAPLEMREYEADVRALQGTLSSRQPADNTMPAVIAVFVLFETMSLIYRTVNFLAFGVDYAAMPEAAMGHLYFRAHGDDAHPHPRTRALSLAMKLKAAHPSFAGQIDRIAHHCHVFFDNLWTLVAAHYPTQNARLSPTWRAVEALHRKAHAASAIPSSMKGP